MTYGGLGIQGIAQTPFYKYITSDQGLSELGIPASEPPKLLKAYTSRGYRVTSRGNRTIILKFGDTAQLKLATPHPANNTGQLQIESWLEWITDGRTEPRGFVPRDKISDKAHKYIRLQAPLGGLMLPRGSFGSTGFWSFPSRFSAYDQDWFTQNISRIQNAVNSKVFELVLRYING